ncbi:MAG: DUF262 domain-containing protein [Pseudomonadota bacterium]
MSYIETSPLKNTTTMLIYAEKSEIKLDPPYQRMGDVWPLEKRQLLIDSILNDYDIPKIYFHIYDRDKKSQTGFSYSVIDGRQRLETIWKFIEGEFTLSDDFEYQRDPSIRLSGLSYEDIAKQYPRIRIQFDSFVLPIVGVGTDDEDLIEDMFSRLNEAVPLNAAEKRNALGGAVVQAIRSIAQHCFFTSRVKFRNNRYQHMEVAGRILATEYSLFTTKKLIDTKKAHLDSFVKKNQVETQELHISYNSSIGVLDFMAELFVHSDDLLRAQGNMVLYYLLFKRALELGEESKITRRALLDFREKLYENRRIAESDYSESSFELLEYDRLSQQGTNDASNIRERFRTLASEIGLSQIEI